MPFDMPRNFQPFIQKGLNEENLTGRARAKFITSVAGAIYLLKSYPTREEYDHVTNQMVKKWGFLDTRTGHVSYHCIINFIYGIMIMHMAVLESIWDTHH